MLERATWGSGQIARPGYPPQHPAGEFFWAHALRRAISKPLRLLEAGAKQLIDRVRAGGLFKVHAKS